MTNWIRDGIKDRRRIFRTDRGRSDRWRLAKRRTNKAVRKRRKNHDKLVLDKFKNEKNPSKFFEHIKCLSGKNTAPAWSPSQLYPGLDNTQIAEKLASFFNTISNEYDPLDLFKIPRTFHRTLPSISEQDILVKLKKAKKPTSMVPGDIPSALYSTFPTELAPIIKHVFNLITVNKQWPSRWKVKYVTVIPKNADPQDPSECRNISCTNFLSKLYESFVLEWSRNEVKPKLNQYGGEPGASSTQLLVEVLSNVTSAMEDNRAGVVLSALDFSKAFNRLDHSKCLALFAQKGASTDVLGLLASFLSCRSMTVKVEEARSNPLPVNAGASQGSVLGCCLFNVGIDNLEEILGVTLDRDATFRTHVACLAAKMRSKTWALARLRKIGLPEESLIKAYKCLIRPTVEYTSPAWHSKLTASQAADLERQQSQALKNIFGPGLSAHKMTIRSNIDLLSKRRGEAAKKFAKKNLFNPRCESWFSTRSRSSYARRASVNNPVYREEASQTD